MTSCSRNRAGVLLLTLLLLSFGCASAHVARVAGDVAEERPQPLEVISLLSDRPAPQMATTPIRWEATVTGGVGEHTFEFWLRKDRGTPELAQSGGSPSWDWTPAEAGSYRVRAVVRDSLGHEARSKWSDAYRIEPTLRVRSLSPDRPQPQAAATARVRWKVESTGGVGKRSTEFRLRRDGGEEQSVQTGPSPAWDWTPEAEGLYRVRAIVSDERGNRAESSWSELFEIVPRLAVSLSPDRPSPQMATTAVRWSARAEGGAGERTYVFEVARGDGPARVALRGPDPLWTWTPLEAGTYRVRVRVTDALGNEAEGPWSEAYEIAPKLEMTALASDRPAPQMATTPVRWEAAAAGGVGEKLYMFFLRDAEGGEKLVQEGLEPAWEWIPEEAGRYRVGVTVTDERGNIAAGEWSAAYEIAPRLRVESPMPDREAPRMATTPVRWAAAAAGGVGDRAYTFRLEKDAGEAVIIRTGKEAVLAWIPEEPGVYRMKVRAVDGLGNAAESPWSAAYEVAPKLEVTSTEPDRPAPQMATTPVRWEAAATGGVGERAYTFRLEKDAGEAVIIRTGKEAVLAWIPEEPGVYRMKVRAVDGLGNAAESPWSAAYEVAPKLEVTSTEPDRPAPQMATTAIRWTVVATGGVGERTYAFRVEKDWGEAAPMQTGGEAAFAWTPEEPGVYRVKARAVDALGNEAEGPWSEAYEIAPKLEMTAFASDRPAPQMATTPVRWEAAAAGGVGEHAYEFWVGKDGGEAALLQSGKEPVWTWAPGQPGVYRVRVRAVDALGNGAEGPWSSYEIAPKLTVISLLSDRPAPQAAGMATVRWSASVSGGVGERSYEFVVSDGREEHGIQRGPLPAWAWRPQTPGSYRVKVVVRDAIGNGAESGWSAPYEVAPKLVAESLSPDREAPQAAGMAMVRWTASASGGVGVHTYEFIVSDGREERSVQRGSAPAYDWRPQAPGSYRVQVVVRDAIGNVAERSWAFYDISPAFERGSAIAVMPVENLSGAAAPVEEIRSALIEALEAQGVSVLEESVLEAFMARHRMRHTGGLTKELGEALRVETGAKGVLFTSLELYDGSSMPKMALTSRLVYAGKWAGVLWMDGVVVSGNDSPGILGLGLIRDPRALGEKAVRRLGESLQGFHSGKKPRKSSGLLFGGKKKFRPKEFYASSRVSAKKAGPLIVAVLPFRNESTRRNAGEIMTLHFVRHLAGLENVEVVEPGVVRQALLTSRTIMEQGLSLPQADLLRDLLGVDLVLAGSVMDYLDYSGTDGIPKVDFSSEIIDTAERKAIWSSVSYGRGTDGVFFFGAGKVNTAHAMASGMAREVIGRIVREEAEALQDSRAE